MSESGCARMCAFVCGTDMVYVCLLSLPQLLGRTLRVDHKLSYQPPKKKKEEGASSEEEDELAVREHTSGHAYEGREMANEYTLERGVDLFAPQPSTQPPPAQGQSTPASGSGVTVKKHKKDKKEKKDKDEKKDKSKDKKEKKDKDGSRSKSKGKKDD